MGKQIVNGKVVKAPQLHEAIVSLRACSESFQSLLKNPEKGGIGNLPRLPKRGAAVIARRVTGIVIANLKGEAILTRRPSHWIASLRSQ
jgi:hypothetical protein